jgi:hypothetical protein
LRPKHMPYVTSVGRMAKEEGRREALLEGLELKFGSKGKRLLTQIRRIGDVAVRQALHRL